MRKQSTKCFMSILCALAMLLGLAVGNGVTFAAYDRTNVFRENCEEPELDTFKWDVSKESSSIRQEIVGNSGLTLDRVGNMSKIAFHKPIALAEGESVELSYTIYGVNGVNLYSMFTPVENEGDGLNMVIWQGQPQGILNSAKSVDEAPNLIRPLDTGVANANAGLWLFYNNPVWVSNIPESSPIDALCVKTVFTQSGDAFYYMKHPTGTAYNLVAKVEAGVEYTVENETYVTRNYGEISQGYLWISANGGSDLASSFSDAKIVKIAADKSETVVSEDSLIDYQADSSDWKIVSGNQLEGSKNTLIIDNAPVDEYLIKKSPLGTHENVYASKLFEIDLELSVQGLSGEGEGVVYFAVSDKTDLTDAFELYVTLDAENKTVMGVRKGSEQIVEEKEISFGVDFKEVHILCKNDYTNEITVDGSAFGSFTAYLGGTYFAFGTKGIAEGGRAKLMVNSVNVDKYNYLAGTGGDFVEDFDDDQINMSNLVITVPPHVMGTNTAIVEDGALKINAADYGWSMATAESYADFVFTFKIRSFKEYGTLAICWGKPTAEAMYTEGCVIYMQESTYDLMDSYGMLDYEDGYSRFSSNSELGAPVNIYDYDFSKGALIYRLEKVDETVSLFVYYEDEPDSVLSKTPVLKLKNSFVSGSVGICGMATGAPIQAVIDDFGIKNLDVHHFETPVVSTSDDDRFPYADTLPPAIPTLNISADKTTVDVGEYVEITATLTDSDETVTFESSDETIATVDETGKVTTKKAGIVTITARAGDLTETIEITVNAKAETGGCNSVNAVWMTILLLAVAVLVKRFALSK